MKQVNVELDQKLNIKSRCEAYQSITYSGLINVVTTTSLQNGCEGKFLVIHILIIILNLKISY